MTTKFPTLYQAARSGDEAAKATLLELVRPRLLKFVEKRMGKEALRLTEAEDLTQAALLDLLQRLRRFPEDLSETEFFAYSFQLAKWRLADLFTKPLRDVGESRIPGDTPVHAVETGVVTRDDDRRWTREQIKKLPQSYADVLIAYYADSKGLAEIAQSFDLTQDATKKRLSRGRQLLRDMLRPGADHKE